MMLPSTTISTLFSLDWLVFQDGSKLQQLSFLFSLNQSVSYLDLNLSQGSYLALRNVFAKSMVLHFTFSARTEENMSNYVQFHLVISRKNHLLADSYCYSMESSVKVCHMGIHLIAYYQSLIQNCRHECYLLRQKMMVHLDLYWNFTSNFK